VLFFNADSQHLLPWIGQFNQFLKLVAAFQQLKINCNILTDRFGKFGIFICHNVMVEEQTEVN